MFDIKTDNPIGAEKARQLPEPSWYKILIMLPQMEEKTEGGVYIPEERRSAEETASIVGFVIKMGDLCYQDASKFPTGPWCKEGDWVMFRAYSGTRFKVHSAEFRLINDDTVEAVVQDPRGVRRA